MSGHIHQQPQQQASKAQRLRAQLSRSALGLHHDFGMPPDPAIAQHQRHAHAQQTQGWFAAAGANARLMHLAIGRLDAKMTAIRGANPTQGTMLEAPGGLQQRLALMASPLAPRTVTDYGQVKCNLAFFRALQGIGGPSTLLLSCQCIGAGGAPRWGGFFPAFDRRPDEGQCPGDQVLQHPHAVKTPIKQQKLDANPQGDHTRKQDTEYMIHGLLGLHAAHGQGVTTASDHGRGGGVGEKVGRAPLGFAAADFVLIRVIHGTMVGQCDQINGHPASTLAQSLGNQLGQGSLP